MTEDMNLQVNVYKVGDIVRGKVVKLEDKQVLVDIEGSKQSGIIPISELSSLHIEKTSDAVSVGDEVTAIGHRSRAENERRMKAVRIIVNGGTYDVYPTRVPEG